MTDGLKSSAMRQRMNVMTDRRSAVRTMTWFERGRIGASLASFVLVGTILTSFFGNGGSQLWRGVVILICIGIQLLFHLVVMSNWRGVVDQQLQHERDRLRQTGFEVDAGAAQQRRKSLRRTSTAFSVLYALMFMVLLFALLNFA